VGFGSRSFDYSTIQQWQQVLAKLALNAENYTHSVGNVGEEIFAATHFNRVQGYSSLLSSLYTGDRKRIDKVEKQLCSEFFLSKIVSFSPQNEIDGKIIDLCYDHLLFFRDFFTDCGYVIRY
jgi:hypothetical protein